MTRIPLARFVSITVTCVALLAASAPSSAQPSPAPPAQGQAQGQAPGQGQGVPPGTPETMSPGEFNRMFEAYALLQAQNQLKLTDEQYADFIVRLRGLQNARRRHQQSRQRLLQDLRRLTNPQNATTDEAAIRTSLDALAREDATAQDEITKSLAQVDDVLDVRQRARFRLLEEQLERWKLDLLSRVRRPGPNANKVRPPKS
jgi:Spy/CpxP family protein refolding chaperone